MRGGYPPAFVHFAIAEEFHASPLEVAEEWDEEMVTDALQLMDAKARDAKRRKTPAGDHRER